MPIVRPAHPDQDFTLEHYREILNAIKRSHKTFSFRDAHRLGERILDEGRFAIIRHDIEFNLAWALRIAELDAECGVHATFFLLQTSEYNPFEEEQALTIRRILELGHDIGLHYDAGLFERLGLNAPKVAERQIALFEEFFQTTIYAMSSHMPMRSGKTFGLHDVVDTYDPLYLTKIKYVSDSLQAWREGCVIRLLDKYPQIHLLVHEYTWNDVGSSWEANLLLQAKEANDDFWCRSTQRIAMYKEGLTLRTVKDAEFKRRFSVE
jgi:hypothetical protein